MSSASCVYRPVSSQAPKVPSATLARTSFSERFESVFPVVDNAGAVGRQMGDPSGFQHARDDGSEPVSHQMSTVTQNHRSPGVAGDPHGCRDAVLNGRHGSRIRGRRFRVDEDVGQRVFARALHEGVNAHRSDIKTAMRHQVISPP